MYFGWIVSPVFMRSLLICLLAGCFLAGCKDDCFYSREPELRVIVNGNENLPNGEFQKVYGLDGKQAPYREGTYFLPVSLHADSVTYLFESPRQVDSLTIFYTRRFFFESEKCGMVVALEDSGWERAARTTFQDAWVLFDDNDWGVRRNVYEVRINP